MYTSVNIEECACYQESVVRNALDKILSQLCIWDCIKPGIKIGIKVNLVSALKPESAAVTHPMMVSVLCDMLHERGASVIVGDSPGGLYNQIYLNNVYAVTHMSQVEKHGATLNRNFNQKQAENKSAKYAKRFIYTAWLDDCDIIINFSKLKTHGMMSMSAAVKNMFGVIPGTCKPEYHYRYPNSYSFAGMLTDLNQYFHPEFCIVDAVTGMEGNGPTAGTPRHIGAILASKSPYCLDLACAKLIGLNITDVPTLQYAFDVGYAPDNADKLNITGDLDKFIVDDYKTIRKLNSIEFLADTKWISNFAGKIAYHALCSRPVVKKSECVGCTRCYDVCPADAITMKNKIPYINRSKCIHCFCCQEFCPKGALKVYRPVVARMLNKN